MKALGIVSGVIYLALWAGCTPKPAPAPGSQEALVDRGRKVYAAHCTACHATNPRTDAAIGPAVWGSSRELLEARILRSEYPPGYKPKRETQVMRALPMLKNDIEALHTFLNNN